MYLTITERSFSYSTYLKMLRKMVLNVNKAAGMDQILENFLK